MAEVIFDPLAFTPDERARLAESSPALAEYMGRDDTPFGIARRAAGDVTSGVEILGVNAPESGPPTTPNEAKAHRIRQQIEQKNSASPDDYVRAQPGPGANARASGSQPMGGGAISTLRRAKREGERLDAVSDRELQQVSERVQEYADTAKGAAMELQRAQAEVFDQKKMLDRANAVEQQEFQSTWEQRFQELETNVQDAIAGAGYSITPEERRHHQSVLESPFTTDQQKQKARSALEKGSKVDPDRVFGGSTAAKVASFIAATLFSKIGGLQVLEGIINRDIESQRLGFAKNQGALEGQVSLFGQMKQRFGDERLAMLGAQEAGYQAALTKLDEIQGMAKSQDQIQNAEAARMEIMNKVNLLKSERAERQKELAYSQAATEAGLRQQQAMMMAKAQGDAGSQKSLPSGLSGAASSTQAHNEAVDAVSQGRGALMTLERLNKHVGEEGFTAPFTDADSKGEALAKQLQMEFKDLLALGVLTGPDMEIIDAIIPSDPGGIRQDRIKTKLDEAKRYILDKVKAKVEASGMRFDEKAFSGG